MKIMARNPVQSLPTTLETAFKRIPALNGLACKRIVLTERTSVIFLQPGDSISDLFRDAAGSQAKQLAKKGLTPGRPLGRIA